MDMDSQRFTNLLLNAQQSDDCIVQLKAKCQLLEFQHKNFAGFLKYLSNELTINKLARSIFVRILDEVVKKAKETGAVDGVVMEFLLDTFSPPSKYYRSTVSQIVADISDLKPLVWSELIALPLSKLKELHSIEKLKELHSIETPANEIEKIERETALQTLAYLWKEVSPQVYINKDQLLQTTESVFFEIKSGNVRMREIAFECLLSLSLTDYDSKTILELTRDVINDNDEEAAVLAIEFWSSICDKVIAVPSSNFIRNVLSGLINMLLETLSKQTEDQDGNEGARNIAMACGTCLGLVARTVGNDIVPLVMPFIRENIRKPDWRQREACYYAFGSILEGRYAFGSIFEGPSAVNWKGFLNELLSSLLIALEQQQTNVTTLRLFGKIFKLLFSTAELLSFMHGNGKRIILNLQRMMHCVQPNVAEEACDTLCILAHGYAAWGSLSPLTDRFDAILQLLFYFIGREDIGERSRTNVYETLIVILRPISLDAFSLHRLFDGIKNELNTLESQMLSSVERDKQWGLLFWCLKVLIQKLPDTYPMEQAIGQLTIEQAIGQMMDIFQTVLNSNTGISATVCEKAMLAIGALTYTKSGSYFENHMPKFQECFEVGLQNVEEYQFFAVTLGFVVDISRALQYKFFPCCENIMSQIDNALSNRQIQPSMKPLIFSCFGHIALSIGIHFEMYLQKVMEVLQNEAECIVQKFAAADDMKLQINSITNGVLEAYSGLLQGLSNSRKTCLFSGYAAHMLKFLNSIYLTKGGMDDLLKKTAIGVLGYLADTTIMACSLIQKDQSHKNFLRSCLESQDNSIKKSAEWAVLASKINIDEMDIDE